MIKVDAHLNTFHGQVAQLVEHRLSKQKVASSDPGSAWSWGKRRRRSAKGPIGSMRPPGPLNRMFEKSCVRVKWGAV